MRSTDVMFRIPVDQVHIENGEPNDTAHCAIALAISSAGFSRPEVDSEKEVIAFTDERTYTRFYFRMTGRESMFVRDFDNGSDPGHTDIVFLKGNLMRTVKRDPNAPKRGAKRKAAVIPGTGTPGSDTKPRQRRKDIPPEKRRTFRPTLGPIPVFSGK